MKKWTGGVLIIGLALVLVLSYSFIGKSESSKKQSAYDFFNAHPVKQDHSDVNTNASDEVSEAKAKRLRTVRSKPKFRNFKGLGDLYRLSKNMTRDDSITFLAWEQMRFLFPRSDALPDTAQGIKEAAIMLKDLLLMIEKDNVSKLGDATMNNACPRFVSTSNATLLRNETFLEIPCGLVEDSSVTLIGIPDSLQDSFQIELIGSQHKEELKPPVVLQYNVLLPGQNLTKEPITIQNTWTQESGWGKEEKCPNHDASDLLKVDGLVKCNTQMVRRTAEDNLNASHPANRKLSNVSEGSTHASAALHFVEGNPFAATLWAGYEGFHMTVNGRHETSFTYRKRLEPWLVNRVNVRGGLNIVSILAKGLPVSEDVDLVGDAQELKATPLSNKRLVLLIGVFSSGNNFERRMALRRTWMQYDAVRSGDVVVRFFIGLHKNKEVNFKLWREAEAYGDIQLMPFVDYYGLLTYKTIAICILGGKSSNGLLYGHISFESAPQRDKDNKWFISDEEWPHSSYPPWAHGPGYIISQDIARFIVEGHQEEDLMLFKLEDVALGIWIEQFEKKGQKIEYVHDDRFNNAGCESDYILAHYQNPRMMLCLWEKLQKEHKPECYAQVFCHPTLAVQYLCLPSPTAPKIEPDIFDVAPDPNDTPISIDLSRRDSVLKRFDIYTELDYNCAALAWIKKNSGGGQGIILLLNFYSMFPYLANHMAILCLTRSLSSHQALSCSTSIQTTAIFDSTARKYAPKIRSGSHTDIGPRSSNEDEHIRIDDLCTHLGSNYTWPESSSFYAVFDGHGGRDAAVYMKNNAMRFFFEDAELPQTADIDEKFLQDLENVSSQIIFTS
ncbi:UNVERIFIED_CONTAM: Hydroxyproline O-galactosyltransferase GALT3 [Sesamum calycinum]|uniref:Hydroxyproline O-galactosyltransferase GALT3 n=1 Tax=Sesamum calycinum TaxID=2727403 RepID=A0AAW2SZR0_9LAMI